MYIEVLGEAPSSSKQPSKKSPVENKYGTLPRSRKTALKKASSLLGAVSLYKIVLIITYHSPDPWGHGSKTCMCLCVCIILSFAVWVSYLIPRVQRVLYWSTFATELWAWHWVNHWGHCHEEKNLILSRRFSCHSCYVICCKVERCCKVYLHSILYGKFALSCFEYESMYLVMKVPTPFVSLIHRLYWSNLLLVIISV